MYNNMIPPDTDFLCHVYIASVSLAVVELGLTFW